jgi:hypothetical protein
MIEIYDGIKDVDKNELLNLKIKDNIRFCKELRQIKALDFKNKSQCKIKFSTGEVTIHFDSKGNYYCWEYKRS